MGLLRNLSNLAVTLQYQPCNSAAILTNSFGITTLAAQTADKAYLVVVVTLLFNTIALHKTLAVLMHGWYCNVIARLDRSP